MSAVVQQFTIPLPGGKELVLGGDFPLTLAQWGQFMTVLDAMKPGLVDHEHLED